MVLRADDRAGQPVRLVAMVAVGALHPGREPDVDPGPIHRGRAQEVEEPAQAVHLGAQHAQPPRIVLEHRVHRAALGHEVTWWALVVARRARSAAAPPTGRNEASATPMMQCSISLSSVSVSLPASRTTTR